MVESRTRALLKFTTPPDYNLHLNIYHRSRAWAERVVEASADRIRSFTFGGKMSQPDAHGHDG